MALVRKNIQMSPDVAEWFENRSKEMGVSQSALMTIALRDYIDKEKAMSMVNTMKDMLKAVSYTHLDMKSIQEQAQKVIKPRE